MGARAHPGRSRAAGLAELGLSPVPWCRGGVPSRAPQRRFRSELGPVAGFAFGDRMGTTRRERSCATCGRESVTLPHSNPDSVRYARGRLPLGPGSRGVEGPSGLATSLTLTSEFSLTD